MISFNRRLTILFFAATLVLGLLFTLVSNQFARPGSEPVVLEMQTTGSGPVYLRWGDGAGEQIALEPETSAGTHRLEVVATGERNPDSKNDEVWILSLVSDNGEPVPLSVLDFDENWELRPDGTLGAYGEKPARVFWEGTLDSAMTLELLRHPFSGQVEIGWDDRWQTLDLYAPVQESKTIELAPGAVRWRGELPPESIEQLELILDESVGDAQFSQLRIGEGSDAQVWEAERLARSENMQGLTLQPINEELSIRISGEQGALSLPGFSTLARGGSILALLGRWLGLTLLAGIIVAGAFVAREGILRSRREAARRRIVNSEDLMEEGALAWLLDGRWGSLLAMALAAGAVMLFLFLTIHQRTPSEIFNNSPTRYSQTILVWIEHGFLRHGGLRFLEPVDQNPNQFVWRSSTMGYLQFAHLLERIYYLFTGRYSVTLMNLHNQAIVAAAAALIGLLSMRLSMSLGVRRLHALALGLGALILYQTFPINLWYFWEIYPTPVVLLFAAAFLLFEDRLRSGGPLPGWYYPVRALIVFWLVYADPVTALMFLGVYILFGLLVEPPMLTHSRFAPSVLLPAGIAVGLALMQILWVRVAYPDVVFHGSGLLFRSGFDGSVEYVRGFMDLFYSRFRKESSVYEWEALFFAGLTAFGLLFAIYQIRLFELRRGIVNLFLWLGLYVPFGFLFNQAVIIHPYEFDIYVAAPLVIAVAALLPAALERITAFRGFWVFLFVMTAFAYAMIQIRTYAIEFPLS